MTWERILKGSTIRKGDWDIEWQVDTDAHWKNYPDGYDDVNGKVTITKTEGSVDIDVRGHGIKSAWSSVHRAYVSFEIRVLHEDGEQYEDLVEDDFEVEILDDAGVWAKGDINPDMITFNIDMNKSLDPKKWNWNDTISWRGEI
jgi:hypothetical protein